MALKTISKTGVATGQTIEALQVSQSADAFTGQQGYKITISGSLITTGSVLISGSSADGGIKFAGIPSGSKSLATLKIDTSTDEVHFTTDTVTQGTQGATGTQGASGAGSQGTQGTIGSLGPQGAQGSTGANGSNGTQGTTGAQGETGIQGTVGSAGSTGAQGSQGTVGSGGSQGPTGAQGTSGITGPQGATGVGLQGTVGAQGAQGTIGAQGIQGTVGGDSTVPGPQGTQGPSGATINTSSFYESSSISASIEGSVITFNQGDETTETITVVSSSYAVTASHAVTSATRGMSDVFNTALRYLACQKGTDVYLELTSFGDYIGAKDWNRVSTTLNFTSSAHGLDTGDVVMVRNASADYVHSAITKISNDKFSLTVPDSGGTTGVEGAYIPCFSASVTNTSGDVSGISITAPGGLSGSAQLSSLLMYANDQQTAPLTITLPAGTQEGAGTYGSKQRINLVTLQAQNFSGTGNSTNLSAGQRWTLGSNFNQLKITAIDTFSPVMLKVNFF